jgi:hypothetical protein
MKEQGIEILPKGYGIKKADTLQLKADDPQQDGQSREKRERNGCKC